MKTLEQHWQTYRMAHDDPTAIASWAELDTPARRAFEALIKAVVPTSVWLVKDFENTDSAWTDNALARARAEELYHEVGHDHSVLRCELDVPDGIRLK